MMPSFHTIKALKKAMTTAYEMKDGRISGRTFGKLKADRTKSPAGTNEDH
jgi:hypothetical protein